MAYRGELEIDEEGCGIPLPEIPTSIDPQNDPDHSSWGDEAAHFKLYGINRVFG